MIRYDKATFSCRRSRGGKIGSLAQYDSKKKNATSSMAPTASRMKRSGCVQGTFCPPISRGSKRARIPAPSKKAPGPSIRARRCLKVAESSALSVGDEVLGSKARQRSAAMMKIGVWPKKDLLDISEVS